MLPSGSNGILNSPSKFPFSNILLSLLFIIILCSFLLIGADYVSKVLYDKRLKEFKALNKKITLKIVLKSLKNRDKSDRERKHGPLKKTKDSILINTTKLSKKACFMKIKDIMDRKLKA